MQNLIVLGIIPGTHIQTTLNFWIAVYLLLSVVVFRARLTLLRSAFQSYLIAVQIARTIDSFELS
jgi:uncharacterized protein (DUF983 family)